MYRTHNIQFLCYSQMMEGRSVDALKTARLLETRVPLDAVRSMPMAEFLVPMPYIAEARFSNWDAILREPQPPEDLPYTSAIWHYARGLAYAGQGKFDAAAKEQRALDAIVAAITPDRPLGFGNTAKRTTALSAKVLAGEIASAQNDHKLAEQDFAEAVAMQDTLVYEEPPLWYFPVRERLGAELFAQGQLSCASAPVDRSTSGAEKCCWPTVA